MTKYIFVTGGVVSSLGKGITAASLGRLLKSRGYKVTIQKFDPYMNVDPGTMSPYQHGEVFVTDDGAETDLDLGHYERFIDINLSQSSNTTSGRIFQTVINKERRGDYLGRTVQIIPHITDEIKSRIYSVGKQDDADIVITEIGGTVGDIESQPFLEAIRQVKKDVGRDSALYIHVTLVPFVGGAGELKTKPTQHSVKELRSIGITPDILVCRSEQPLSEEMKEKLALFCDVDLEAVIENKTIQSIYEVPLMLEEQHFDDIVLQKLALDNRPKDMRAWYELVEKIHRVHDKKVNIAIVGKYVELQDAYISVIESLRHAAIANDVGLDVQWIEASKLETELNLEEIFAGIDGILVPGGFGDRGIEGKMLAAKFAREHLIPYYGLCLGMQTAVIEFARNVVGLTDAHSTEFNPNTPYPVIDLMPDQVNIEDKGGTMRLGAYPCKLRTNTHSCAAYGSELISERHRHRYEFNNTYRQQLTEHGLIFAGTSPDDRLVEIIELDQKLHPWFVAVQFHPELKSRPTNPHPLFKAFIKAGMK